MLDTPSKLFGEAIIPDGVYYEGVLRAKKSERVAKIKRSIEDGLIKISKPTKSDIEVAEELQKTLGLGERYTIAIGISKKCLIATDDLKPRKVAKVLKLDVIGTLGILRLAYRKDLIDKAELRESVKKLQGVLYFTEDLEKWVLR
jgi:predicted nucleic acid-binding protein